MVVWFMTEFLSRVWSAGCRSRYQQLAGRLQFMRRPLCIIGESSPEVPVSSGSWSQRMECECLA